MELNRLYALEMAVGPKALRDWARFAAVIDNPANLPPGMAMRSHARVGRALLMADDERDMTAALATIRAISGVEITAGPVHVAYRETVSRAVTVTYTHKRVQGPKGEFAEVTLAFDPQPQGAGFRFESAVTGGAVPEEYLPAIGFAIRAKQELGMAGTPLTDVVVRLVDGKHHEVDSCAVAFEAATLEAFRKLAGTGVTIGLEPVVKAEIETPNDCLDSVIGDLNRRGAKVSATETRDDLVCAVALAPVAAMRGYAVALPAMTQGRGKYRQHFDHYAETEGGAGGPPKFPDAAALRIA